MKKILFLGDMHLPFVDKDAFALALKVISRWKPDAVVQVGDILDNRALKRHTDSPHVFTSLKYDNDLSRNLFAQMDEVCVAAGVTKKAITLGNHDTYMDRYLKEEAKALHDYSELVDPIRLLGAEQLGWVVKPYHEALEIGKVSVIHDVNLSGNTAVTRAAAVYGGSVVFGHTHAAGVAYTGDMTGERYVAMNVGWLGDLDFATYLPAHQRARCWTHGVGFGRLADDGVLYCNFAPFVKNRTVIEGIEVSL